MADQYKITSTSRNTAKVEDKVIHETSNSRRVLRPEIIANNPKNPAASVKISFVHQKIGADGWVDIEGKKLSNLSAGDIMKLILSSEETLEVFKTLEDLYLIHKKTGVKYGSNEVVIGLADEIIKTDPKRAEVVRTLVEQGHSEEIWQQLIEANPDLATQLSHARLHQSRREALNKFEQMLKQDTAESDWQDFFDQNKWIFGYGLNYQILRPLSGQPNYGGERYTGKGKNKGDFLGATGASVRFTVLIEIKKPNSTLVEIKQYRNDVHCVGPDLLGGVSQLRGNAHKWQTEGSTTNGNRDELEGSSIYTVQPKKILVIGDTSQLKSRPQRESFELFRRNQSDLEIVAFDELLERAKFIIAHEEPIETTATDDS